MHSTGLALSSSHLMHASLAYLSPEVVALDRLIILHSRRALVFDAPASATTVSSLPIELLLDIRSNLIQLTIADSKTSTLTALAAYESAMCDSLCGDCLVYNRQVFGEDPWGWSNYNGGCDCARIGVASSRPEAPVANMVAHKDKHAWLEAHLSTLTPSGAPIWDVVERVVRQFGCELSRTLAQAKIVSSASDKAERCISVWRADVELALQTNDGVLDAILSDVPAPSVSRTTTAQTAKPDKPSNGHVGAFMYHKHLTTLASTAWRAPAAFVRDAAAREPVILAGFVSVLALRFALGAGILA